MHASLRPAARRRAPRVSLALDRASGETPSMFVGHFGLAFAAKRASPRSSLATLFAATAFLDLVWPVLVLAGIEKVRIEPGITAFSPFDFVSYPWSHSAAMALLWSVLFGGVVLAATRDRASALVSGALVFSHWVLDLIVHRPDLPLWPGGPRVGLGLWYSVAATLAVEGALFVAGVWIYSTATQARDRIGRWALGALIVFLAAAYLSGLDGSPPPSPAAVAWVGVAAVVILLPWAAWIDRHRVVVEPRLAGA